MDNRGGLYGQYLMGLLAQMMKTTGKPLHTEQNTSADILSDEGKGMEEKGSDEEKQGGREYFAQDETACSWRREEKVELLARFCREGYSMGKKYGHFLLGEGELGTFIAVPGRFLIDEQPAGGVTGFTLWQPLSGGEVHYENLGDMDEAAAQMVYGYWIARLDGQTLEISEF